MSRSDPSTPIRVRPLQGLFFGPPRSLPAGDAHHAASLFPPPPMTFQGMVRTRLLYGARPALDLYDWSEPARRRREELIGTPEALPEGWQLVGPYPASWGAEAPGEDRPEEGAGVMTPWLPAPRMLLDAGREAVPVRAHPVPPGGAGDVPGDGKDDGLDDLCAAESPGSPSGPEVRRVLVGAPEVGMLRSLRGWVSADSLLWALRGDADPEGWRPDGWSQELPPFVARQRSSGLALHVGRAAARTGLLYFLETLRFEEGSGLVGWLHAELPEGLSAASLHRGTGLAGGGGRLVAWEPPCRPCAAWSTLVAGAHLPDEVADGSLWWMVTLGPVLLDEPARPEIQALLPGGVRLEVCAALLGPPLTLGGFSLAGGAGRPNRPHVPGGSAWLVRVHGGSAGDRAVALRTINGSSPLGPRREAAFGFGQVLIGHVPGPGSNTRRSMNQSMNRPMRRSTSR
jgi:CRISPR-associated protein Cmr3